MVCRVTVSTLMSSLMRSSLPTDPWLTGVYSVCNRFLKPNAATVLRTSGRRPIHERWSVTLKKSGLAALEEVEVRVEAVVDADAEVDAERAAVARLRLSSIIVVLL